ncbi:MAG: DUF1192 domain-containing protein [Sphingorhabdus sp.]
MDDDLPQRQDDPLSQLIKQDLDPLSLDELDERIELLRQEVARCEAKKAAASGHMQAADALFKKE